MITIDGLNIYINGTKHNSSPLPLEGVDYDISDVVNAGSSFQIQFTYVYNGGIESAKTPVETYLLPVGINPNQVSSNVLWIDTTNSNKITVDGSNNVTGFEESSTDEESLTTIEDVIFDNDGLFFGVDGLISDIPTKFPEINLSNDLHFFMCFKLENLLNGKMMFINPANVDERIGLSYKDGEISCGYYNGSFTTKSVSLSNLTDKQILEFTINSSTGDVQAFLNGTEMSGTSTFYTSVDDRFEFGDPSSGRPNSFRLYDLSVFDEILSTTNRANVLSNLQNRHGVIF